MTILTAGFADPVFDAQAVFRAVMMAMARPGEVRVITPELTPPAPLMPVTAALALTLLDYETPVWLDASLMAAPEVAEWLKFHTGARVTPETDQAAFAIAGRPAVMPPLYAFALGTLEYPDRSTTLILQVDSLNGGNSLVLSGPGIKSAQVFSPERPPADFAKQLADNCALFPRGVDVIFAAPEGVAALPRSVKVIGES